MTGPKKNPLFARVSFLPARQKKYILRAAREKTSSDARKIHPVSPPKKMPDRAAACAFCELIVLLYASNRATDRRLRKKLTKREKIRQKIRRQIDAAAKPRKLEDRWFWTF